MSGKTFGNKLVSYAQNLEDIILWGYFCDSHEPGFYVDIGANHPTDDSVTKFFSLRGWKGINVEPLPELAKELKKDRPRDKTVRVGISDKLGAGIIRVFDSHGLSTLSANLKEGYKTQGLSHRDIKIKLLTLNELLKKYNKSSKIAFLKVDVEGLEYQVLSGNDWKKFRPQVVCVESTGRDQRWKKVLKDNGYILHIYDGLNEFYVAKESKELIENYRRIVASNVIRHDIASMKLMMFRDMVRGIVRRKTSDG